MRFPDRFLERYRQVVPDFETFLDFLTRPLRTCIRLNTLKGEPERILARLADLEMERLPWYELGRQLTRPQSLGNRLEHFLGLFYVQEAASMLPPLLLDPQPGERVLDAAAAPGSKTTQIAQMMANTGLIVANDSNKRRIRGLTGNLDRTGALNVIVTCQPGQVFGKFLPGYFDRILLDAPCSAEGTIRKSYAALEVWSESSVQRLSRIQIGLLISAFRALKPGGVMVYSTCTFAPEENEGALSYFFTRTPEAASEPVALPGLVTRPPLESWQGEQFHPAVGNALRILPQDNDTEGFFICRIRKQEAGSGFPAVARPSGRSGYAAATHRISRDLARRFGFPSDQFRRLALVEHREDVFLTTPEVEQFTTFKPVRKGIRLARVFHHGVKPTTNAMQLLGRHATRSLVELDRTDASRFIQGEVIQLTAETEPGFVIARHDGFCLGVGLYKNGQLKSQVPLSRRTQG